MSISFSRRGQRAYASRITDELQGKGKKRERKGERERERVKKDGWRRRERKACSFGLEWEMEVLADRKTGAQDASARLRVSDP